MPKPSCGGAWRNHIRDEICNRDYRFSPADVASPSSASPPAPTLHRECKKNDAAIVARVAPLYRNIGFWAGDIGHQRGTLAWLWHDRVDLKPRPCGGRPW